MVMKLNEKIRKIRKEKGFTMLELQAKIRDVFGENALKYNTLARIEQGKTNPRMNSLLQISTGLGVTLRELKEGIEEETYTRFDLVKKNKRTDRYTHNPKTYSEILTPLKRSFLCVELVIEPHGKTLWEQDPMEEDRKFEKWIYCLKGEVICHIGQDEYPLKKGDCLSFESTIPHYFENRTKKKISCIIVQNPRHI